MPLGEEKEVQATRLSRIVASAKQAVNQTERNINCLMAQVRLFQKIKDGFEEGGTDQIDAKPFLWTPQTRRPSWPDSARLENCVHAIDRTPIIVSF